MSPGSTQSVLLSDKVPVRVREDPLPCPLQCFYRRRKSLSVFAKPPAMPPAVLLSEKVAVRVRLQRNHRISPQKRFCYKRATQGSLGFGTQSGGPKNSATQTHTNHSTMAALSALFIASAAAAHARERHAGVRSALRWAPRAGCARACKSSEMEARASSHQLDLCRTASREP